MAILHLPDGAVDFELIELPDRMDKQIKDEAKVVRGQG